MTDHSDNAQKSVKLSHHLLTMWMILAIIPMHNSQTSMEECDSLVTRAHVQERRMERSWIQVWDMLGPVISVLENLQI